MREWLGNNQLIGTAAGIGVMLVALVFSFALGACSPAGHQYRSGVEPKASLAAYSWEELSAIAQEIAQCETEDDAIWCAAGYWLCRENGSVDTTQVKPIELADGSTVNVMIAGVWSDECTDGGKAGITFVFTDAAGTHAMTRKLENAKGDSADSAGGWAASNMRVWLNGEFFKSLPEDLSSRIVSVQKLTASSVDASADADKTGRLSGNTSDWVSETSDKLWLFSASELCGVVSANEVLGVDEAMTAVYSNEGAQYRLFANENVVEFTPNTVLIRHQPDKKKGTTWWLRTRTLESGDGFWLVGTDGTPLNGVGEDSSVVEDSKHASKKSHGPDYERGVVAGFCL